MSSFFCTDTPQNENGPVVADNHKLEVGYEPILTALFSDFRQSKF